MKMQLKKSAMQKKQTKGGTMRLKREHHEKSTLDRKPKRLKNVDSIKSAFIFVLGSQKSIFPDSPLFMEFRNKSVAGRRFSHVIE